jgi:D-glycero-D-manno-heptose 1,7-bisphosphate phosphatase
LALCRFTSKFAGECNKMVKVCFIDRDGVINKLIPREGMSACAPWTLEQFEFLPRVKEAFERIKSLGYITVIATNQPDVKDGYMTWDDLNAIHNKIREELPVDELFMAHVRGEPDYKPNPGMMLRGMEYYNADPEHTFMIGDSDKDIIAGHRAGINTIWVNEKPWNLKEDYKNKYGDIVPDKIVKSLYEASLLLY